VDHILILILFSSTQPAVINMQGSPLSPPQSGDIVERRSGTSGRRNDSAVKILFKTSPAKETSPSKCVRDVKILKDNCLVLCGELCEILSENRFMLTESSKVSSSDIFSSRCTVGIMLHGTKIENTLVGGPSFGLLEKGDVIICIDGEHVTGDNVSEKLRGCDIPGTEVLVTVERCGNPSPISVKSRSDFDQLDTRKFDVPILRMATAEIADRRRMFDLFTIMEVLCRAYQIKPSSSFPPCSF
jgi:hypothetical protein